MSCVTSPCQFRLERIFQSIKLVQGGGADAREFRLERIFQSIKLLARRTDFD